LALRSTANYKGDSVIAPALPPLPTERRAATRRQPTIGTICRLTLNAGETLNGLVWNISTSGLSMLVHRQLKTGTLVHGVLLTGDEGTSLAIEFRVAHVGPLRTGDYIIGGPFVRPLEVEEMNSFLA
jgi:hypothetical protein